METTIQHRALFRAANASFLFGLLSGIGFLLFYSTDLKPWLLATHLLGTGAFGLGLAALLQGPVIGARERGARERGARERGAPGRWRALAGMVLGIGHAAALGLLFSLAAAG